MKPKFIIFIILLMSAGISNACSLPLKFLEVIPPAKFDGEFTYIDNPTEKERNISLVKKSENIAVVKIFTDWHANQYPHDAITEIELLHGWGYQWGRVIKFKRFDSSCGKPKKLEINKWYVAVIENKEVMSLIRYSDVKDTVKAKGKPEYVYTSMGLL